MVANARNTYAGRKQVIPECSDCWYSLNVKSTEYCRTTTRITSVVIPVGVRQVMLFAGKEISVKLG